MLHKVEARLRSYFEHGKLTREQKDELREFVIALGDDIHQRHTLRARAFDMARDKLNAGDPHLLLSLLEDIVKIIYATEGPGTDIRAFFSPGDTCRAQIIDGLRRSHTRVDICVFTVTDDQISRVVEATHLRGVQVRIITDNDKAFDMGSDIHRLANLGIAVKVDQTRYHMHHKFAIFDRRKLITGSYNWTRTAAAKNQENLLVLDQAETVGIFQDEFERLWQSQPFLHEINP